MSFHSDTFIFDGIPSEFYDLIIGSIGSNNNSDGSSGGMNVDIIKQKVSNKSKFYITGAEQSTPLTFNITFVSLNYIPRDTVCQIQRWLFQHTYKKLQFLQDDLYGIYFNCIINESELIHVNGQVIGFDCKVECDAPWAWSNNIILKKPIITSNTPFIYINTSDDNYYTFPTIKFATKTIGDVIIKNISDRNNEFKLTALPINDVISIDNDKQIITSKSGIRMLPKCNFKWFKLVPGKNEITINGDIKDFEMSQTVARKVGS